MVPLSRFALSLLRRDPASAEEALRAAEALGRSSMDELRRTVGLLRSADEPGGVAPPLPSAGEVASLVEYAHSAGLAVELRTQGDIARIPPAVGVAVYRIAQESLANAARHAPRARTVLELELDAERPFIDPQKETPRHRQGAGSSINVCAASPSKRGCKTCQPPPSTASTRTWSPAVALMGRAGSRRAPFATSTRSCARHCTTPCAGTGLSETSRIPPIHRSRAPPSEHP